MNKDYINFREFMAEFVFPLLTIREKEIFELRMLDVVGIGTNKKTLEEVGEDLGISKARVQQLANSARRKTERKLYCIMKMAKNPLQIINASPSENLPMVPRYIHDLGELSVRTFNCLNNSNLLLIDDLIKASERDLLRMPNFGMRSLNEIKGILKKHNLALAERSRFDDLIKQKNNDLKFNDLIGRKP